MGVGFVSPVMGAGALFVCGAPLWVYDERVYMRMRRQTSTGGRLNWGESFPRWISLVFLFFFPDLLIPF